MGFFDQAWEVKMRGVWTEYERTALLRLVRTV
jgi:hypothetical protein